MCLVAAAQFKHNRLICISAYKTADSGRSEEMEMEMLSRELCCSTVQQQCIKPNRSESTVESLIILIITRWHK